MRAVIGCSWFYRQGFYLYGSRVFSYTTLVGSHGNDILPAVGSGSAVACFGVLSIGAEAVGACPREADTCGAGTRKQPDGIGFADGAVAADGTVGGKSFDAYVLSVIERSMRGAAADHTYAVAVACGCGAGYDAGNGIVGITCFGTDGNGCGKAACGIAQLYGIGITAVESGADIQGYPHGITCAAYGIVIRLTDVGKSVEGEIN